MVLPNRVAGWRTPRLAVVHANLVAERPMINLAVVAHWPPYSGVEQMLASGFD